MTTIWRAQICFRAGLWYNFAGEFEGVCNAEKIQAQRTEEGYALVVVDAAEWRGRPEHGFGHRVSVYRRSASRSASNDRSAHRRAGQFGADAGSSAHQSAGGVDPGSAHVDANTQGEREQ
jgi:hypothetical protein